MQLDIPRTTGSTRTGLKWPVRAWSGCSGATKPRERSSICSGDQFDFVVRYNGGANAGHTVVVNGKTFKLSLLPTGVIRPNVTSVIGNGVVVYPPRFLEEVDQLAQGRDRRVEVACLSDHAHVIFPYHMEEERLAESASRRARSALPAAASARATRTRSAAGLASASANCFSPEHLRERLGQIVPFKNRLMVAFANGHAAALKPFEPNAHRRRIPRLRRTHQAVCHRYVAASPGGNRRPASACCSKPHRAACSMSITAHIRT